MTDVCAGLFLHGAVLAALFERSKSNLGSIFFNLSNTTI